LRSRLAHLGITPATTQPLDILQNNNVKELLADPWIVNRADLPTGLTGAGK
jgi:hypothetical protein